MKIAVSSPSFSTNEILIQEMQKHFVDFKLNTQGTRFTQAELIDYLRGYEAAIIGLEEINKEVVEALPDLKIIAKYGVGLNNIDLEVCREYNIAIGWTGGVNRLSVAEMCLGNMLTLIRNIVPTSRMLAENMWVKNGGEQLTGKAVGIIGLGHIGKELVRLLEPFHCEIWVNDIQWDEAFIEKHNLRKASKEEIYSSCRIISIHTPLTKETQNMVSRKELAFMKDGTILINSARGGIVDETALFSELQTKRIMAALDVFDIEPPHNTEMLSMKNLVATPHIGGNAKEAIELMGKSAIDHLIKYQASKAGI